jgi:Ran GTPase-activating protein (RanGAP) involved in mRNA processing and transport
MRDAIAIIDSIERHMPNLQVLNMSENTLGVDGGKHLAKNIHKMKKLESLKLRQCNITDRGIIEIVAALDDLDNLDLLDLSGN